MYRGHFIGTQQGNLYLAQFGELSGRHVWLYLPPFAEEMNLARAVITRQARALAAAGQAVVCLDYRGTGDSEGEIDQVRLADWYADILSALCWIEQQGAKSVSLWGLRLGGLLAINFLTQHTHRNLKSVLLWKPVLSGKQLMGQFFRLRQVSDSMQGGERINWLSRARSGETVQVAGYPISSRFLMDMESLTMPAQLPEGRWPVEWIEVSSAEISPAVKKVCSDWPTERYRLSACDERSFWQSPDTYDAPVLLKCSQEFCLAVNAL